MLLDFAKYRLDVDDWRAIDGFHWADSQTVLAYLAHGDLMKADRIGPIRGSCREDPCKPSARIGPRVHLQNLTVGSMQPGQDHDLVAHC